MSIESTSPTQTKKERGAVVLFDLDGTLTNSDSFLAFLLTFGRRNANYAAFGKLPFHLCKYAIKLSADFELKQTLIRDFLSRFPMETIEEHTGWFCDNWLPWHLHPIGKRLLDGHRQLGDRLVLLSASPSIFVPAVARCLGFDEFVCTQIRSSENKWTGEILGKNCKGPNKLLAIQSYLGTEVAPTNAFAYGDSRSDRDVLQWVRHGAWIKRDRFVPLNENLRPAFPCNTNTQ